ncbi:MAG: HlyD family efflux transporter periplasmic adaptor subunit [Planctomycetales bacterium]|nr:HlyD family efflux transporter periplasmic adaptor subunit [Planctomycetales bacterium]
MEVINAEIDTIHRQLELLEREQQQLVIRAPISGTIRTERPREKLLDRPVHRGESLLEIMVESVGWQIELAVTDRKIGHLLSHRQHASEARVKFRLLSSAQQSFDCTVNRVADRILPSPKLGSCCLASYDVSKHDLPARQIGSEMSARIDCGQKSLLFIWLHEFWELLQRSWWV